MQVMEKEPQQKELVTVEEIAKELGKSEFTIKQWLRQKKLPGFQIGGTWYMRRPTWLKFLEEQEQNKK